MSYRCGLDSTVAAMLGVAAGPPQITCDGCGVKLIIGARRLPPRWFMDGKAAPGWSMTRHEDGTRADLCKACRSKALPNARVV